MESFDIMTKITILGCGPSSGIPAINGYWGDCDSTNPKNIRQRSSIIVEIKGKNILIDTSPDFKNQFTLWRDKWSALYCDLSSDAIYKNENSQPKNESVSPKVDAVLYTHEHCDHILGINDLAFLSFDQKIPLYGSEATMNEIIKMFPYLFNKFSNLTNSSADFLDASVFDSSNANLNEFFFPLNNISHNCQNYKNHDIPQYKKPFFAYKIPEKFELFNIPIEIFDQDHTSCISTGYKFQDFVYSSDLFDLSENSKEKIRKTKLWIVSCCKYNKSSKDHADFDKVMKWIHELQPQKAILTNMGMDMDYNTVEKILPNNITLAYDGMEIYL
jgi:phosphoribosyl 1,2-cyclic phosphate phosphodiesterase